MKYGEITTSIKLTHFKFHKTVMVRNVFKCELSILQFHFMHSLQSHRIEVYDKKLHRTLNY